MAQYIESDCSRCQRSLRIPTQYLGKRIACKFCNHTFVAQAEPSQALASPASQAVPEENAFAKQQIATLHEELERAHNQLSIRNIEHATVEKSLEEARGEIAHLRSALQDLRGQLEQARKGQMQAAILEQELGGLQREHARVVEHAARLLETEKQAVHAHWERTHLAQVQDAEQRLGEEQARGTAERQKLQRLEKDRQSLLEEIERQKQELVPLRQERENAAKQIKTLTEARDRLVVQCSEGARDRQSLLEEFERQKQELRQEHENAAKQIKTLTEARDRLIVHCSEGPRDRQPLLEEIERQKQELVPLRQERDNAAKQIKALIEARDRLVAQCSEGASACKQAEERCQAESKRLTQDLQQARQEEAAASRRVKELEPEVEILRQESARQQDRERETPLKLAAFLQEVENARGEVAAVRERGARALRDEQDRASAERQNWQKQMEAIQGQFDEERRKLCKAFEKLRQEVNDGRAGRGYAARPAQ